EDREKCSVTAPLAGTITEMAAKAGQSAGGGLSGGSAAATASSTASSALFIIEDTSQLEITASIAEYDVVNIQTGMPVAITTDALTGEEWTGTVKNISAKATDTSGNFTVVVQITSPVGELAIGMSAKINIATQSKENVFAVPYDAVTTNAQGDSIIYVMEQTRGTAAGGRGAMPATEENSGSEPALPAATGQAVVVKTGMETDYYIEIISDELEEGMVVLADPEGKNVSTESSAGIGFGGIGGGMPRGG
ncbi:MAG: efflux RND transporter periplasmic adaptor subunit, partial [Oscillospiraceae bacterium]